MARNYPYSSEPPDPNYGGGGYQQPPYEDEDDFVVELPPAFETAPGHSPSNPAPPQQQPYPSQPSPFERVPEEQPAPRRREEAAPSGSGSGGVSGIGAFLLGMLAQLILLGCLGIFLYLTPEQSGKFFAAAEKHFQPEEVAAPTVSEWAPTIDVNTDVVARMQILELEDRALYGKERVAWDELVRQSKRLDSADLTYDSVQASLMRIRRMYKVGGFTGTPKPLNARDIFPGIQTEADLPATALIQVMRDKRQPSEIRRRAAYLLANEATPAVALALQDTIQDDPNLEVVKQAFLAFRTVTGYPNEDFFDTEAVAQWWEANRAAIMEKN